MDLLMEIKHFSFSFLQYKKCKTYKERKYMIGSEPGIEPTPLTKELQDVHLIHCSTPLE